jgi:alkylhydroperoxidase family enzyme
MRPFAVTCAIAAAFVTVVAAEPRIRPIVGNPQTDEQRALTATYGGAFGTGADFRTLLVHPELVKGVLPFANYILAESTLSPRHRELLILRTAWNTRSDYLWAKHQNREVVPSLSRQELSAIGGRGAVAWNEVERTLLRAADELHEYSFITNDTWAALATRYSVHELMDVTFTVAEMTMLAAVVHSVRLNVEPGYSMVEHAAPQRRSNRDLAIALATPRIEPVVLGQATPEIRAMLDPSGSGRDIAAVYRTFASARC